MKSGTGVNMDEPGLLGTPMGVIEPPPRLWAAASRPFSHAAPQASTAHNVLLRMGFMGDSCLVETPPEPITTGSIRLYLISTAQGRPEH